jgi:hypothetical protein
LSDIFAFPWAFTFLTSRMYTPKLQQTSGEISKGTAP